MRQNCSLAEAVLALFLIRSRAKVLVSSSLPSSRTSSPLTMAPTGLIKSWQTREQSNAARSSDSIGDPDIDGAPLGMQAAKTLANRRQVRHRCVIHRTRASAKHLG